VVKYEALILGLKDAKDMNIKQLEVFGDSELVVSQVKGKHKVKSIRLKQYRNEVCIHMLYNILTIFTLSHLNTKEIDTFQRGGYIPNTILKILIYSLIKSGSKEV